MAIRSDVVDRLDVADLMVCALAGEIANDDFVGVGLGTPLALAATLLARATHAPSAHVLAGGAFDARGDLETYLGGSGALEGRTPGFVSHFDSMDMAERQAMTLQIMRPAQVDGAGNMNTSRIGPPSAPTVRFPGGLATADVPTLLPRLVTYLPNHIRRNLPDGVSFVTGTGGGIDRGPHRSLGVVSLITDLACISFGAQTATLRSVHPWSSLDEVTERTGFTMAIPSPEATTPLPTPAQAKALRKIDPNARRALEIKTAPNTKARIT